MARPPNYRQQRGDRERSKDQKRRERLERREADAQKRREQREGILGPGAESDAPLAPTPPENE